MRDLTFTAYDGAKNPKGELYTRPWEAWVKLFSKRDVRIIKDGPAIIFGEIPKGKRRSKANTVAAHAIGIDIDHRTSDEIAQAFAALEPYEHFSWTTHSNGEGDLRIRIVVPFAEPISPDEFPSVWLRLNTLIGGINDKQTKDICRLHYLPSCPEETEDLAFSDHHKGKWISMAELAPLSPNSAIKVGNVPVTLTARMPTPPIDVTTLTMQLRSQLKHLRNDDDLKDAARALLSGVSFAQEGERHKTILELTWWLASKTTKANAEVLQNLFEPSLLFMAEVDPTDHPTFEEVMAAYEGACGKELEYRHTTAIQKHQEKRLLKKEINKQVAAEIKVEKAGSKGPYTDEDLQRIAEKHSWQSGDLHDRWIIQREGMHWILDEEGKYRGSYVKDDAAVAFRQLLKRAPVTLVDVGEKGVSYRSATDLVAEYGRVAEKVISDMVCQTTYYDTKSMTLFEAVSPLRDLGSVFNPQIDEWWQILAGPQYPTLIDWFSCVPDLKKLLCALYLGGHPGGGKTLIAHGLAKLWVNGPPGDLQSVLSDFNEDIARCPVLFGDEALPKRFKNETVTTKLREMISTTQRVLKRKFKAPTDLHGAIRLVLAANNEFLLDSKGVASADDLEAIAQRFLYIEVPKEAKEYMEKLDKKVKVAWLEGGIAQHVLWLQENHTIEKPGKRFWVEGSVSRMHRNLMTGTYWNSLICQWLVSYLEEPGLLADPHGELIRRGEGKLFVNAKAIVKNWTLYIGDTKSEPEARKVTAALKAIAVSPEQKKLRNGKHKRGRYYEIDTNRLLEWADMNIGDRDTILSAIGAPSIDTEGSDNKELFEDFGTVPSVNPKDQPF